MGAYAYIQSTTSTKGYARTLYENYRARMSLAGYTMPDWEGASPAIKREFVQEAKQLLS